MQAFQILLILLTINLWQGRLGHVNIASIKMIRKRELIPMIKTDDFSKCHVCRSKARQETFQICY